MGLTSASLFYWGSAVASVNDPTFGNTQFPLGWAQYKSVYDCFMVYSSDIKVTFFNTSSTAPVRCAVLPYDSDSTTSGTTSGLFWSDAMTENPYGKVGDLSVIGGGHDVLRLKCHCDVRKIGGLNEMSTADANYRGFTGSANSIVGYAAPTELFNWGIAI
jgi:hypothetical protein